MDALRDELGDGMESNPVIFSPASGEMLGPMEGESSGWLLVLS